MTITDKIILFCIFVSPFCFMASSLIRSHQEEEFKRELIKRDFAYYSPTNGEFTLREKCKCKGD